MFEYLWEILLSYPTCVNTSLLANVMSEILMKSMKLSKFENTFEIRYYHCDVSLLFSFPSCFYFIFF